MIAKLLKEMIAEDEPYREEGKNDDDHPMESFFNGRIQALGEFRDRITKRVEEKREEEEIRLRPHGNVRIQWLNELMEEDE